MRSPPTAWRPTHDNDDNTIQHSAKDRISRTPGRIAFRLRLGPGANGHTTATIYRVSGTCGSGHVASLHEAIVRDSFDEYTAVKTLQVSKHGILAISMRPDFATRLLNMLGVENVAAGCQDILDKSWKALVWDR